MQERETAGDYGYDMAYEASPGHAERPTRRPEPARGSGARRTPELDQGYAYDEAHSF